LVSGGQTFTANFAIPNEGIEQMARKNDSASANPNTSAARAPVMGLRAWRILHASFPAPDLRFPSGP
jgi:hypothetical protein